MRFGTPLCLVMALSAFATVRAQDEPTLEVTLYGAECLDRLVDGKCPEGDARPLVPEMYTLYTQSQKVRRTWPGTDNQPTWVHDCAITDVDNWLCIYSDSSGMFGMLEGKYWQVSRPPEMPKGIHISVHGGFDSERVFYVSREQHERPAAEFGPRQTTRMTVRSEH